MEEGLWRKMDAVEVNMKERILISEMEYSVLKEETKEDRCGWSEATSPGQATLVTLVRRQGQPVKPGKRESTAGGQKSSVATR
jgi:hypothetical protein